MRIVTAVQQKYLNSFRYYLRMERQLSPNTVASYCSDLAFFFKDCSGDPRSVSGDDVLGWISDLAATVSKRSQSRRLSSLRSFFDWMIAEGERSDNPVDSVDYPKQGRYLPEVLSVDEVTAIIEGVVTKDWQGVRDRAILEILYGCGLRVSELCGLRLSNVYADEGFVRVVGKGDKERLVPMGGAAVDAFRRWLGCRPESALPQYDDYVFLNRFGKPLSRVSVFNMVKAAALNAGVTKEISPHTFRHSFATHMIENGADLRVVQEMLGHESILTTEIYTHIDTATWQRSILEHHPRR